MAEKKILLHWPVLVLGIFVAVIFLFVLFVFQVNETDYAILKRFGSPVRDTDDNVVIYDPGLHLKIPFIDKVWRHDNRLHCYELRRGQAEQMQTADDYQVIVTTFVLWGVGDPYRFMQAFESTADAESKLDEIVRNSRSNALGRHRLNEMINVDAEELRIAEIEGEILEGVKSIAMEEYGIAIRHVGFKHLGFPEKVTAKVFDRMEADRKREAEKYRAEGRRDAQKIRAEADLEAKNILADADAKATRIRGEGDQAAAESYAAFRKNPELASFLRKLDALRKTLTDKTTLVLDTKTPPYDLLLPGAIDVERLTRSDAEETTTESEPEAGK